MAPVVQFVDVSKRFVLSRVRNQSFEDSLIDFLHRRKPVSQELWALQQVSFSVESGDLLGIIGRNGSGKSTILKLIARILESTTGKVTTTGRLSSMLELGTGFHPDLTGRENIALYGSLLGFSSRTMDERYPDIIAFAELEQFIDVPLRHYSSGMQMRLGFAVATAIDPDILLVDEVLAVGDSDFQAKCLDRIGSLHKSGKTIIIVSHDLNTIEKLCTRVLWLDHGQLRADGSAKETIARYVAHLHPEQRKGALPAPDTMAGISAVRLLSAQGIESDLFEPGVPVRVEIHYWTSHKVEGPVFAIEILHIDGRRCFRTNTEADQIPISEICGEGVASIMLLSLDLAAGEYKLNASLRSRNGSLGNDRYAACTFSVRLRHDNMALCPIPHRWEVPTTSAARPGGMNVS